MPRKRKQSVKPRPEVIQGYDPERMRERFTFDARAAQTAIDWFPKTLRHAYGSTSPFVLEPWQAAIVANIFGWKRPDGTRRYREVFVAIPRKNGKTQLAAGLALHAFVADGEPGPQVILAACDRDQATIAFNAISTMIEDNEELQSRCKILDSTKRILDETNHGLLRAIAADATGAHGFNASCVLIDELHTQKSRDLYDVLRTGTAARRQPLVISVTTAGADRSSFCYELWQYARDVRDGKIEDDTFLPVIYEPEDGADWLDREVWRAVNPNLGVSISESYLTEQAERAQRQIAYQDTFRQLHLNEWTGRRTTWIGDDAWMQCLMSYWPELHGVPVTIGIDLGDTNDLSAVAYAWWYDETVFVDVHCFCPRIVLQQCARQWHSLYRDFAMRGWLTITEAKHLDDRLILARILEDAKRYTIDAIAYDPWQAHRLAADLDMHGMNVVKVPQSIPGLTKGTRMLESLVLSGRLRHNGNGILRWAISNTEIQTDHAGNRKPDKRTRAGKIDPVNALVMALQVGSDQHTAQATEREDNIILL